MRLSADGNPSSDLPPPILTILGDEPDGAGRAMFAIQLGIPALSALITKMNLIFHTYQFGGCIRMIHTNLLWLCIHCFHYDINSRVKMINRVAWPMDRPDQSWPNEF
jgi:hypothetical protein